MALFQVTRHALRSAPLTASRLCSTGAQQRAALPFQAVPEKKAAFDLPPVKAMKDVPEQGWQLKSVVRPSRVLQAGNGRYAAEFVKTNSSVIVKPLIPMAKVTKLADLPNDVTITFSCDADLEKYITLASTEGGHSREDVLSVYEHFIYGFDGKVACLNVSTWTVNHGDNTADGLNVNVVEETLPGGATAYVGKAMIDIHVDDELYMDYRKFKLPDFYMAYTKKHGFKDVRTATVEAVYGSE